MRESPSFRVEDRHDFVESPRIDQSDEEYSHFDHLVGLFRLLRDPDCCHWDHGLSHFPTGDRSKDHPSLAGLSLNFLIISESV